MTKPAQVRLVNLDLDSPRLQSAMEILGYEAEDLNTHKRKENFREEIENEASSAKAMGPAYQAAMNLNTIMPQEVDDALVNLRYKHY